MKNCLDTALAHLARREHSRAELRGKLLRKFGAREVDAALDELAQQGAQCDRRFAEAYVAAAARRFGAARVVLELQKRGIARDMAASAAAAMPRGDDEAEAARRALMARHRAPPADETERQKRVRFLMGRGFSPAAARRAAADS